MATSVSSLRKSSRLARLARTRPRDSKGRFVKSSSRKAVSKRRTSSRKSHKKSSSRKSSKKSSSKRLYSKKCLPEVQASLARNRSRKASGQFK